MQTAPPAAAKEWTVNTLRGLALAGMAITVAAGGRLELPLLLALIATALWTAGTAAWWMLSHQPPNYRRVSVAGDLGIAALLFVTSAGMLSGALWAGILPLVSVSVYYGLRGALLITALCMAGAGLACGLNDSLLDGVLAVGIGLFVYSPLGVVLSLTSRAAGVPGKQKETGRQVAGGSAGWAEKEKRKSISQLAAALSSTLNYQKVLETAVELSAEAVNGSNGTDGQLVSAALLFAVTESGKQILQVGSARGFTPADHRQTFEGEQGLLSQSIDAGAPQFGLDPGKDPELSRIVTMHACRSAYCIPLRTGLDTCGVLLFAHPVPDFFTQEKREILEILGHQATIAIENARLYQDLEQEKERMLEIQEEARKKIARDLHDGPTQSVAAIAMRVNFARRLIERDPKATADELFKIEELARRTTKEIRHMLFTLRPLVLESQGLIAALESMAEKMKETYGQNVIIQADPRLVQKIELNKQGVIFYIAEEAVNNARKHAEADHIWVRLKPLPADLALLEIEDDGKGFNLAAIDAAYETRGSLGLVNMRERTELVNGVIHIDSVEGSGTRIQVAIPLTEEAAERIRRGQ